MFDTVDSSFTAIIRERRPNEFPNEAVRMIGIMIRTSASTLEKELNVRYTQCPVCLQ